MLRPAMFCAMMLCGLLGCSPRIYTYQVNVATGARPSVLLEVAPTGITAAGVAELYCTVTELEDGELMSSAVVIFTKFQQRTVLAGITNGSGVFEKKLPPGRYEVEVRFTGKNTFRCDTLSFDEGIRYRLGIGLGNSGNTVVQTIRSKRPLTPAEAAQLGQEASKQE